LKKNQPEDTTITALADFPGQEMAERKKRKATLHCESKSRVEKSFDAAKKKIKGWPMYVRSRCKKEPDKEIERRTPAWVGQRGQKNGRQVCRPKPLGKGEASLLRRTKRSRRKRIKRIYG